MDLNEVKRRIREAIDSNQGFLEELKKDPAAAVKGLVGEEISAEHIKEVLGGVLDKVPFADRAKEALDAAGRGLGKLGIPGLGDSSDK